MYSEKNSKFNKNNKDRAINTNLTNKFKNDIKALQEISMSRTWNNSKDKAWDKL